jgi:UDP-glucose 4-epimerase
LKGKHLKDKVIVELEDINLLNPNEIFEECDYVFHEAALPSVPRSIKDPLSSNESNITCTLKILLAARDCEISKLVFASSSSSSVYGDTYPTQSEIMPIS